MDNLENIARTIGRHLGKRCARTWILGCDVASVTARLSTLGGLSAFVPAIDENGLAVADLKARKAALPQGTLLAVDNTLAGPVTCPACVRGADVVADGLETLPWTGAPVCTVSLSADALRCQGLQDLVAALAREAPCDDAAARGLAQAFAGYERLEQRRCDNAQVAAEDLACHPAVRAVRYPGLKGDPSHDTAARMLEHGFGISVEFEPDPSQTDAPAVIEAARSLTTGGTASVRTRAVACAALPGAGPSVRLVCGDEEALAIVMWIESLLG